MKKALAILSALALVATAATAEVKVGAWGRAAFIPASSSGSGDPTADFAPDWGGKGRVGVNFSGSSDNIGFNLNLDSSGGTAGIGDQAKIWVKPVSMITVELGKIQGDTLRGKFGDFGLFGDYAAGGEDDIFARFNPKFGTLVSLTPAEGVYIGAALDAGSSGTLKTADMVKGIQAGAGYTIANVGLVRAQYIGSTTSGDNGFLQAAFNLTAVKGLNADIGAKINLNSGTQTQMVAAAVGYSADALSVTARVKANIATKFGLGVAAKVDYTVAAPVTVGVSGGYKAEADVSATGTIYAEPYVKLGYSNGYAMAGFKVANSGSTTTWALPIGLEYWF